MTYGILLAPHANARYEDAVRPLSQAELTLLLEACDLDGNSFYQNINGVDFLCFHAEDLDDRQREILSLHSMLYFAAEIRKDLSIYPLFGRHSDYLGSDLPSILKYKGKTNEAFTNLLINLAYTAAVPFTGASPPVLLDPMCGRGTTLFSAVNRGFDAVGIDIDQADISESSNFFARYLKYHKIKHTAKDDSLTIPGGKNVSRKRFEFARNSQDYKDNKKVSLSLVKGDAATCANAFRDATFHLICADLPYGVQHASKVGAKMAGLTPLLTASLPVFYRKLKRGGAISLSFNSFTLKRDTLRQMLSDAGFKVLAGGAYDGLEHWVEQAVQRDAVVAVKE